MIDKEKLLKWMEVVKYNLSKYYETQGVQWGKNEERNLRQIRKVIKEHIGLGKIREWWEESGKEA